MDVGGLPNKLISGLEKNAMLAAFGAGVLERAQEANNADPIGQVIKHFTDLGITTGTGGGGGYGALGEAIITLKNPNLLMDKLFRSNHLYTMEVKAGIALYLAAELGVLAPKWKTVGMNVLKGGAAAAIVMPGSAHPSCDAFNNARPNSYSSGQGQSGGLGPRGY